MKPYGRKKIKANHPDCHPEKGWVNWWEKIVQLSKKRERREAKLDIKEQAGGIR